MSIHAENVVDLFAGVDLITAFMGGDERVQSRRKEMRRSFTPEREHLDDGWKIK